MGHTTRCISIIRHLLILGHQVTVAGNEIQQQLIRDNFPTLCTVYIDGYNVKYHSKKGNFIFSVLGQLPRLAGTIRNEHMWLKDFAAKSKIDGIISDNRYGFWHPSIPCVILTHQPAIKTGFGRLADAIIQRLHYSFLNKFKQIWLVDNAGNNNLGNELSHPARLPANARYIGLLSQMIPVEQKSADSHLLILLSGPEPQRTLLEHILWPQVSAHSGKVIFIAGKANATIPQNIPDHITYHTQLPAKALQPLLEAATYIISRGGYSTLMDLAVLRKKALLIPTPGQTEQQYLAGHLSEQGIFPSYEQDYFSLEQALKDAVDFPFHPLMVDDVNETMKEVLNEWLTDL